MATIGQILLAPELGWKRFDDTDSNISYEGSWTIFTYSSLYGGTSKKSDVNVNSKIKFNFTGTKIRLIAWASPTDDNMTTNSIIRIDGTIVESFSCKIGASATGSVLVYEKTGLNNNEHYVEIDKEYTKNICLDAIDIDYTGKLKFYNEDVAVYKYLIQDGNIIYSQLDNKIIKLDSKIIDYNLYKTCGANTLNQFGNKNVTIQESLTNSVDLDSGTLFTFPLGKDDNYVEIKGISLE